MSKGNDDELVYRKVCEGHRTIEALDLELNEACRIVPDIPRTPIMPTLARLLAAGSIEQRGAEYHPAGRFAQGDLF